MVRSLRSGCFCASIGLAAHLILLLLEVEQDVNGVVGFVGLDPVAHIFVVDWEIVKNLRGLGFQLGQEFFKDRFVEDFALGDGPSVAESFLRRR